MTRSTYLALGAMGLGVFIIANDITAMNVAYSHVQTTPPSTVKAAVSLSGAALGTGPVHGDPPTMDFRGTADPLVPYQWATNTVDAAHAAGDLSYLITWDGEGHVPYVAHRDQILTDTVNFFYAQLRLGPTS